MRRVCGFTLLEVLIAMAILSIALLVVMRVMDQAALVSRYQDQQIIAATLARRMMVDVELQLEKDGFGIDDKEECGNFAEVLRDEIEGHAAEVLAGFEYCWTLEKVELPLPMDMLGGGGEGQESAGPISVERGQAQNPFAGGLPGGVSPEAVAEQLGKAVRQLKLSVKWKTGEIPQELTVTTHLVNMTQAAIL